MNVTTVYTLRELRDFREREIKKRLAQKRIKKALARELLDSPSRVVLSAKQKWAIKQFSKKKQKLVGQEVKLISDTMGRPAGENPEKYKGSIVGFGRVSKGMPRLKIHWVDDKVRSVWLYQVEFLREHLELTDKERVELITNELLGRLEERKTDEYEKLKRGLTSIVKQRKDFAKKTKETRQEITTCREKIKAFQKGSVELADIEEELRLINQLETVEDAYISEKGNIIVLTKNLPAIKRRKVGKKTKEREDKKIKIGRFVFLIGYSRGGRDIRVLNRDWEGPSNHGHPNLSGDSICWGSAITDVNSAYREGRIFQLVDFIITFLSLYPQDEGAGPYMSFGSWMTKRKKLKSKDNDLIERRLYVK